jgi:uncharacterized membrane protein
MLVVTGTLLGAILGAGLFSGFDRGALIGAAIGALAGWALQLNRRLKAVEGELAGQSRRALQQDSSEPPSARVSVDDPPRGWAAHDAPPPIEQEPATAADAARSESEDFTSTHRLPHIDPRAIERMLAAIKDWCTTGNIPVKVGIVLSVFGVGFLVKEAIDRSWVFLPIWLRLIGVALFGIVLLAIGWRLRKSRPNYAQSMQGGGVAVVYLTTYAAYGIYDLMPAVLAFLILVAVTAAAGSLAVLQNSRAFAVLGIVGGFMAPLLASDGSGNHVLLFSYYAILNLAVFGIAWFKAWRVLNVLGFVFTFLVGALWGYTGYRPEHFASTEPFLVLFVAMYTVIPIFFAGRETTRLKGYVDGTLVFGTPMVGFGLQSQLVADSEYGLAISAVVWALVYMSLATYLLKRQKPSFRTLAEAFFGLGIVFVTIAVPLALDARWTSAAWALQGAAMIWLGWRQERRLALLAGIALQALAAGAFSRQSWFLDDPMAFLNGYYLGAVLIALAAWFSAWVIDRIEAREHAPIYQATAWLFAAWGTGWWLAGGVVEIGRLQPGDGLFSGLLLLMAGTTVLAMTAAARLSWVRIAGAGGLAPPHPSVQATAAAST